MLGNDSDNYTKYSVIINVAIRNSHYLELAKARKK